MKKKFAAALILVFVVIITVSCVTQKKFTENFPTPSGEHKITGTYRFVLDDPRHLLLQVWYPAENKGAGVLDPAFTRTELDAMLGMKLPIGNEALEHKTPTNSYVNAPIMPTDKPYPIILFDHGFGGYEKQNLTQMEELASHGYVVFAVNHPRESAVTQYPDGTVALMDTETYPSLEAKKRKDRINNATITRDLIENIRAADSESDKIEAVRVLSSVPRNTTLKRPIAERTIDILNVMEALVEMSQEGFFAGLIDTNRVGMYGHSMGGNATNAVASLDQWPVNLMVAANLDGPQLIFPGDPVAIPKVPFMICYSDSQFVDGITVDMHGASDYVLDGSDYETWRAVFNGTYHLNFSDLTYVKLLEGSSIGEIDGRMMGHAVESLLVAWFDRHLKGKTADMGALEMSYDLWELDYELRD